MSDIFASDSITAQHKELGEAFADWTSGKYLDAKTIGQVVLRRRQDALIEGARSGFADSSPVTVDPMLAEVELLSQEGQGDA